MASRVGLHPEWDGVLGWVGTLGGMTHRVDDTQGGLAALVGWHSEVDGTSRGGIAPRVVWHLRWVGILGGMAP